MSGIFQDYQIDKLSPARELLFANIGNFDRNRSKLYIACSGGLDSMSLLFLLTHWLKPLSIQPIVLHVNYHLRGAESDGDEALVVEQAQRLGLSYQVLHAEPNPKGKIGIQAWARELRYDWFRELTKEGDRVILAHHEDDLIETILMRIVRGSSLLSLEGMKVSDGPFLRPFLTSSRKSLEEFAAMTALPFREDSSNQSLDYSRNRLRHRVLPELEAMFPGAGRNLLELARSSSEWGAFASRTIETLSNTVLEPREWGEHGFAVTAQIFIEKATKLGLGGKSASAFRRSWLLALYQALVQGVNTTLDFNEDWEVRVEKGHFDIERKSLGARESNRWKQYQGELTNSGLASCLSPGSILEPELEGDPEMQDNKDKHISSK